MPEQVRTPTNDGPSSLPVVRLRKDIYAAWSYNELVILDLKADKYIGLDREASHQLATLLGILPSDVRALSTCSTLNKIHPQFRNFIEASAEPQRPTRIYAPVEPGGLSVCDWRPRESIFSDSKYALPSAVMILEAIVMLWQVNLLLYRKSLYGLIKHIEFRKTEVSPRHVKDYLNLIAALHMAVQRARAYYPRSVDCLTGSGALALMLLRRRLEFDFIIGIQKYPFYGHAWVEHQGMVVNDVPEVKSRLSVILRA